MSGMSGKNWSDNDIALLKKLYPDSNKTLDDIEARLGRTKNAIHVKAGQLELVAPHSRHFRKFYDDGHVESLTEIECAYIAGILDGEGSLVNTKGYFWIPIVNTDFEMLEWIRVRCGGYIRQEKPKDNRKQAFTWVTDRIEMVEKLLRRLQPYLIIKKGVCETFLRHQENLTAGGNKKEKPHTLGG